VHAADAIGIRGILVHYFAITLMFCLAWPRPFVVGAALMAGGALLEGLQALTAEEVLDLPTEPRAGLPFGGAQGDDHG
jgi:hypothetical protein